MLANLNPKKGRIVMAVGMFALAISLFLISSVHPATQAGKDWLDGIFGLFMGVSLGLNFTAVLLLRRLRASGNAGSSICTL